MKPLNLVATWAPGSEVSYGLYAIISSSPFFASARGSLARLHESPVCRSSCRLPRRAFHGRAHIQRTSTQGQRSSDGGGSESPGHRAFVPAAIDTPNANLVPRTIARGRSRRCCDLTKMFHERQESRMPNLVEAPVARELFDIGHTRNPALDSFERPLPGCHRPTLTSGLPRCRAPPRAQPPRAVSYPGVAPTNA